MRSEKFFLISAKEISLSEEDDLALFRFHGVGHLVSAEKTYYQMLRTGIGVR